MPYTCRRCGLPVPQGLDVCPNCGATAQRPDAIIRCRHCHRRAPSHLAICPHCGRQLRAWRPDAPLAAVALFVLAALWLGFGDGARVFSGARTRLAALLPPPATLTPPVPFDATSTPEEIALIPTPDLQAEPPPAEIEPLDIITATEPITTPPPLTLTTTLTNTTATATTVVTTTAVISPTASATPTSIPSATSTTPATPIPTPLPTATPSPVPTASPSPSPRPTPTPTPQASATPTPRPLATPPPNPTSPPAAGPATYTIQPRDTLLGIAQRVGRTIEALAAYNNISDPRALKVGQILRIPPADYTPPAPTPIPTRPTATRTPTPPPAATPTPAITLPAPILASPGSGSAFTGSGSNALIYLKWQNPGGIPEGAKNVLHVGVLTAPDIIEWRLEEPVGQATDYKLPSWLFGQAPQEFGRTYIWYVQVVGDTPLSPPSPQWRFQWD